MVSFTLQNNSMKGVSRFLYLTDKKLNSLSKESLGSKPRARVSESHLCAVSDKPDPSSAKQKTSVRIPAD